MLSKFLFLSTFATVCFIGLTAEEGTTEVKETEQKEVTISANDDKEVDDKGCTGCEIKHATKKA